MKVLHTIPYFNKASGGPVSCTYQLVAGLVDYGVNCKLLSFRPNENDIIGNDAFIEYLQDDRKTSLWLSKNMERYLKKSIEEYDIIHVNTIWTWPSHIPVKRAKKAHKPLIISPHGMLYPQALRVSSWKKRVIGQCYLRRDLESADCIHATSEAEARHIRSYGVTRPIAVIPNCLDVSAYPAPRITPNKVRRFGFTGRIHPIKNLDLLLAAWKSLGGKTVGCELVIIGDGNPDYVDQLKKFVRENHLDNVSFLGFLSGADLRDVVKSLDFQILPSKSENFGMVVPEALISGVPVIASTGTPWSELSELGCGWWVDPTLETLSTAILNAIQTSENDRLEMGEIGRRLVLDHYSSIAVAEHMSHLYNWLIRGGDKPNFMYNI